MEDASNSYRPIDCNYYDLLEAAAVQSRVVNLEYYDESDRSTAVKARIADLQAINGEEFLTTNTGITFRLDRLISMDGHNVPDQGDTQNTHCSTGQ